MPIVFRLERGLCGRGPYRTEFTVDAKSAKVCERLAASHDSPYSNRPSWMMEQSICDNPLLKTSPLENFLAGCDSRESLKHWFGEFFQPLLEADFTVVEYIATKVIKGKNQLVFIPQERL